MELQASTFYPALGTASSGDTVEMLSPPTASVAKLMSVLRPPCPLSLAAVETFLTDERADLTPSQFVERKLSMLVKGAAIPVSHFRHKKTNRRS